MPEVNYDWPENGLGIFLAPASAAAVAWQWNHGALPLLHDKLQVAGLEREVEVLFDGFGLPHIKVASLIDCFFARALLPPVIAWFKWN
jgi:hypothetical protein